MSTEREAKAHAIKLRQEIVRQGLWPTCTNCAHWVEVSEVTDEVRVYFKCGKFNLMPPEDTVVVGCVHHDKEVPF